MARLDDVIPRIDVDRRPRMAIPTPENGTAAAPHEVTLDDIMAQRRRSAVQSAQMTAAELDQLAMTAQAEEFQDRIEEARETREERRRERQRARSGGDEQQGGGLTALMFKMLNDNAERYAQQNETLRTQLTTQQNESLALIREQLQAMATGNRPPDVLEQTSQLKALWDGMKSVFGAGQAPPTTDMNSAIAMIQVQEKARLDSLEYELRKAESEDQRRVALENINTERMRLAGLSQMWKEASPVLSSALLELIADRTGRPPAIEPPALGRVAPPQRFTCPYCQAETEVPAGIIDFVCSNGACGRELSSADPEKQPPPGEDAEPAADETGTEEPDTETNVVELPAARIKQSPSIVG